MKVTIDSVLRLSDVPPEILEQIKAELTIKNPQYETMKRIRPRQFWMWGEPVVKLWREVDLTYANDIAPEYGKIEYVLPRGYYARLWNLAGLSWDMVGDRRVKLPEVEYPSSPQLRDYQAPAVELARDWQQGVVIAPCGTGKTEMGMGIIEQVKQPTLWIAHTLDLINQSMERAKLRLGLSGNQIGIIQGQNMSIGSHITFATVQTLSKRDLSRVRDLFGCIVVDESHLVVKDDKKARMFADVIAQFPAFYRFGLTASEYRSDGLIETMFHVIGPKFYEVAQDDPRLSVMKPRVEFVETEFRYDLDEQRKLRIDRMIEKYEKEKAAGGDPKFPKIPDDDEEERLNVAMLYEKMREDFDRQCVVQSVLDKVQMGDYCLVLGDSLEHLSNMYMYVRLKGYNAGFVNGETKKPEREKILKNMRDGKLQFLFATYSLAKLGLDIPRLNVLVLATPKRDRTSVQQAVGRIMRPEEGKGQPIVYDIWDSKVTACQKWARERAKVYLGLGCTISGGPKVRGGRK